jgi:4-hydroxybenzoate polyprenyltransferase
MPALDHQTMPSATDESERSVPVLVDLDGTLARVDTLHEQIARLALRKPFSLIAALPALLASRARFKHRLAQQSSHPPPTSVVWNEQVLDSLRQHSGTIGVCTASNQAYAAQLCRALPVISEVFGSDAETNLKGAAKAAFLREKFGHRGFQYYGNDRADLPVWQEAAKAFVVSDDPRLLAQARQACPVVEQIPLQRPSRIASLVRAMRPHQWVKNLLLFVPIVTSHRFSEGSLLVAGILAFAIFCLLTSAVYLLNDVIDLDADRQHPSKRRRPFAAGDVSVLIGLPLAVGLMVAALGLAVALSPPFAAACGVYLLLAVLYSTVLKTLALLDVYTLATLYTLRLFAGGAVTGIPISVWLAAFSIFIFLSLALCKRYTEIRDFAPDPGAKLPRRGYFAKDAAFVLGHGLVAMGCATLVLAVYLSSDAVALLYRTPGLLWVAVLIVSFWGARLWLLASRQQVHEDPVLFALQDKVSWICLLLLFGVFFAAMSLG